MNNSLRIFRMIFGIVFLCISAIAIAEVPPIECECRDQTGNMRSIGFVECISINGIQHLVRCEMSTNTPYWSRLTDNGCIAA